LHEDDQGDEAVLEVALAWRGVAEDGGAMGNQWRRSRWFCRKERGRLGGARGRRVGGLYGFQGSHQRGLKEGEGAGGSVGAVVVEDQRGSRPFHERRKTTTRKRERDTVSAWAELGQKERRGGEGRWAAG
jgi:hypothetical protein